MPADWGSGELCVLEDDFSCFLQCDQPGGGQQGEETEAGDEHCVFLSFST